VSDRELGVIRIRSEAALGTLPPVAPGTVAELPQPDGTIWRYYGVGGTPPEIAARLGWTQANAWLREPERDRIIALHDVFPHLERAVAFVLANPTSVYAVRDAPTHARFVSPGFALRQAGLLASRTTRYVDAIIEPRTVEGGTYLRAYHFAPASRDKGQVRLWP
jgi:hypothetical protein